MSNPFEALWFHGTDTFFETWMVPPPPKPGEGLAVPHTALFFTTHEDFAAAAGSGLCTARLCATARVLDATQPSADSEALRRQVAKNSLASAGINISDSKRWTKGWNTGDTLRFAFTDPKVLMNLASFATALERQGLSTEQAAIVAQHNLTRGLIELICTEAHKLGFDAVFGHEVDRHSGAAKVARPWLAVLNKKAITPIEWVRKPPVC